MSDGRINVIATLDDKDYNKKLENMSKGVKALETTTLKMTDKQIKAYERLSRTISENKEDLKTATDPTQVGLYTQRLKDAEKAMAKLVSTASKPTPIIKSNSVTSYNSQGNSIGQMQDALGSFKDRLVGEKDINNVRQLNKNIQELETNIKRTTNAGKKGFDDMGNAIPEKKASNLKNIFSQVASYFGVFTAITTVIGLIKGAFNTIVQFDSQLLNVSKTTGLAGQELKNLGVSLRGLSDELKVVSISKLTEYATVAGQLGVKGTQDILAFTKALAMLEITSNISGEEGGSQIARFLTLTDGGVKNVADFGDEVTKLGNNFAATEAEIVKNSLSIAQNTGVYKLGRQEALAYGTATKSIGVEAELTGATVGRTLAVIDNILRTGKNAQSFSKITGESVEDLKAKFKTDPSDVLYSFVKGLNDINKSGGSVVQTLNNIGINGDRDEKVLGSLASNGFNVLTRALEDVGNASGSMQSEFDTASGKISNSIEAVKVSWENFILSVNGSQNTIGEAISFWAIKIAELIKYIGRLSTSWQELQRLAGEKGYKRGFDFVLGSETNADDAIKELYKVENARRSILNRQKQLEKELENSYSGFGITSVKYWKGGRSKSDVQEDIEKTKDLIGEMNGQMAGYRKIISGVVGVTEEVTNKTDETVTKTKEQLNAEKKLFNQKISFIEKVAKLEKDINQSILSGRELELAKITEKYADLTKEAEKLNVSQTKLNELRLREIDILDYKRDTENIKSYLEGAKSDYAEFEEYKKKIGIENANEMYKEILDVSKSYQDLLTDELNNLSGRDLTDLEKDRFNVLSKLLADYSQEQAEVNRKELLDLMARTTSEQQQILNIRSKFAEERKLLENETNEALKAERLDILKKQEDEATAIIFSSIYDRNAKERELIRDLSTYSKNQLEQRIKTNDEFLANFGNTLSDQEFFNISDENKLLKSLLGATDQLTKQKVLLEEKKRITDAILKADKTDLATKKKLLNELFGVNILLDENEDKLGKIAKGINIGVESARMLADAFAGSNDELQKAIGFAGQLANNILSGIKSGDFTSSIMSVSSFLLSGISDVFGFNKGEEEAQRAAEKRRLQEEYNKLLRDQLLIEIQLNDAYQSRVDAIKEESDALLKNKEVIINRMKEILNLFNGAYGELSGVSVFDFDFRVGWKRLGLDKYFENGVELSDELLNKLEELNSKAPLKGKYKDLFEELQRLRDEFGSVNEAVAQLNQELINTTTGTTTDALASSIIQGLADGKRSFEDFADDIEGFLRDAILAGLSTSLFAEQIKKLQDDLAEMLEGGLTEEEAQAFKDAYMAIVNESKDVLDMINQAGIDFSNGADFGSNAKDGIKRITETQADRLTGILTGVQVDVIESRKALQLHTNLLSSSYNELVEIQVNTRRTADSNDSIDGKMTTLINAVQSTQNFNQSIGM